MSAVENTIPVLPVSDITRSLQYFTQTLGWTEVWRSDNLGAVSRDGHQIMLSQLLPVNGGTTAWIGPHLDMVVAGPNQPLTPLTRDARALRLLVHPYTVRADSLPRPFPYLPALLQALFVQAQVDGVFTDHPDQVASRIPALTRTVAP